MNEIQNLDKFLRIKIMAEDNGIELIISGKEIIIQKNKVIYRAKSIDECFGFILGFIHLKNTAE